MAELVFGDLTPEQAAEHWTQIEAYLKPLLAYEGLYEPVDILVMHAKGERKIWIAWDPDAKQVEAVIVTHLVSYPRGKRVLWVPYVAGKNMPAWKDKAIAMIEAFARAHGCFRLAGGLREGWVRAAGYRKVGVMLVKEL